MFTLISNLFILIHSLSFDIETVERRLEEKSWSDTCEDVRLAYDMSMEDDINLLHEGLEELNRELVKREDQGLPRPTNTTVRELRADAQLTIRAGNELLTFLRANYPAS